MPRQNIDYNKRVIYKIEHEDKPDLLYVGSTLILLDVRIITNLIVIII